MKQLMSQGSSAIPSVIVFGLNEWNDNWQTRQYISSQLGKRGWSVVYTTGAGDLWVRVSPMKKNTLTPLAQLLES